MRLDSKTGRDFGVRTRPSSGPARRKNAAATKTERIDLHGINREIQAVQKKLKGALPGATEEEQKHIAATIRRLEDVRTRTATICPKVWSVWPIED